MTTDTKLREALHPSTLKWLDDEIECLDAMGEDDDAQALTHLRRIQAILAAHPAPVGDADDGLKAWLEWNPRDRLHGITAAARLAAPVAVSDATISSPEIDSKLIGGAVADEVRVAALEGALLEVLPFVGWTGAPDGMVDRVRDLLGDPK